MKDQLVNQHHLPPFLKWEKMLLLPNLILLDKRHDWIAEIDQTPQIKLIISQKEARLTLDLTRCHKLTIKWLPYRSDLIPRAKQVTQTQFRLDRKVLLEPLQAILLKELTMLRMLVQLHLILKVAEISTKQHKYGLRSGSIIHPSMAWDIFCLI